MKKFAAVFAAVLMLASTFAMAVTASPYEVIENPAIDIEKVTPVIDGNINDSEGWSKSALMNYETLGFYWAQQPLTSDGNVRFAWDENNFYYCANIIEGLSAVRETDGTVYPENYNTFIYSTGDDDIDVDANGSSYGYNGDIFGLLIDPLGEFINYGYTGNQDFTPWYLIGLFEGDVAKMYRGKVNEGDITEQVSVAGHKTEKGWCFEAAIPWDIMIKDIDDLTFGEIQLNKDDIFTDGAHIRVGAMYHDRFYDEEAEEVSTWGRFVTAPSIMADGNPGNGSSGDNALTCGINLYVKAETALVTTEPAGTTAPEDTTVPGGNDTTVPGGNDTTVPGGNDTTVPGGNDTTVPGGNDTTVPGGNDTTVPGGDDTTKEVVESDVVVTDDAGAAVTDEAGQVVTEKVTVEVTEEAEATEVVESDVVVTDEAGVAVTDEAGQAVTEKVTVTVSKDTTKPAGTGAATGETSTQTFDIGIAVALGALATSGIGFVATKKRK